jgi:cytochrome c oxidase assembly protein subunit 15
LQPTHTARWVHYLAVATACATLPLIVLGGLVTTYDIGMAVPDAPTTFGYNMLLYPIDQWLDASFGVRLEHAHRYYAAVLVGLPMLALAAGLWGAGASRWIPALGAVLIAAVFARGSFGSGGLLAVGGLTVLAALACWFRTPEHWLRWLGVLALGLVLVQGGMGALRVNWNDRAVAVVHGCLAQLFFVLTAALALATSPAWNATNEKSPAGDARRLQRLLVLTTGFVVLQLILGAMLRHLGPTWALHAHLTVAVFVVVHAGLVAKRVFMGHAQETGMVKLTEFVVLVVGGQLMLGAGAWATSAGFGPRALTAPSNSHVLFATGHVALGALLLAACVLLTMQSFRRLAQSPVADETPRARTDSVRGTTNGIRPNVASLEPRDLLMTGGAA